MLIVVTAGLVLGRPAVGQEPVVLTGVWEGTWFMGKYEEPLELHLTQAHPHVVGRITLWSYPTSGAAGAVSTVRVAVAGRVEGHRVQLTWAMPEQGQFQAELTLLPQGTLIGYGGVGTLTTGFDLHRPR